MAETIVIVVAAYAALGAVVALGFVLRGLPRVDSAAAHSPLGFRLLIFPGLAALWPWALVRWLTLRGRGGA